MNSLIRDIKIEREVRSGDFRDAMRQLAGGVSIITVGRGKDITGMTVTSVSSLSVEPPTLIVSVNRQASSWPLPDLALPPSASTFSTPISSTSPNGFPARAG